MATAIIGIGNIGGTVARQLVAGGESVVLSAGDPDAVLPALRREVQSLDRNLILQAESVNTTIRESLWAQRLSAGLLGPAGACLRGRVFAE